MDTDYNELNIKHIKLSSGDEILGLIAGVEKGMIHIEYPVIIDMVGDAYMLADYMPTSAKNIITLYTSHVVAMSDVFESVKHEYVKYCLGMTEEPEPEEDNPFDIAYPTDKSKFH
jgi:hypothetical protein